MPETEAATPRTGVTAEATILKRSSSLALLYAVRKARPQSPSLSARDFPAAKLRSLNATRADCCKATPSPTIATSCRSPSLLRCRLSRLRSVPAFVASSRTASSQDTTSWVLLMSSISLNYACLYNERNGLGTWQRRGACLTCGTNGRCFRLVAGGPVPATWEVHRIQVVS